MKSPLLLSRLYTSRTCNTDCGGISLAARSSLQVQALITQKYTRTRQVGLKELSKQSLILKEQKESHWRSRLSEG